MKFQSFAMVAMSALALGAGPCKSGTEIELSILHTNDIHCHLRASAADAFGLGGVAKLATLVRETRAGRAASITLDAGDWCEGEWYYSLDGGAAMLRLFDAMDYDAVALGNHDYLLGPDMIWRTVRDANARFPVLAANLDFSAYGHESDFRKYVGKTTILERAGLKIGIIGLTTVDYFFASFVSPLVVTEMIRSAQEEAAILRPQVDVLIVLSHNQFTNNVQLARSVLGVDAVVSGHSHRKIGRAVMVPNAGREIPVVEAGDLGAFLGDLRLKVNKEKKTVTFSGYELHAVLPSIEEDPTVARMVDGLDDGLDALYGGRVHEAIATSEIGLDHGDSHEAGLADLAAKAYRDLTGADLSFEILALAGVSTPPGPLTVFDLHNVLPHIMDFSTGKEWTVKIWDAPAKDVGLVANVFYTAVNFLGDALPNTGVVAHDGIEIVWQPKDKDNPVARVTEIRIEGEPIDMGRRYQVALTDGMLLAIRIANEKLHLGVDLSRVSETGVEGWRAVLAYARELGHLTAENLKEGGRSYTTVADPALPGNSIRYSGTGIELEVGNDGLSPSGAFEVVCANGRKDDALAYGTPEEAPYTEIGRVEILPLSPGQRRHVSIPWRPASGSWPVRCSLEAAVDGYPGNNGGRLVLDVPLR